MKKYHKAVIKIILLVAVFITLSLVAPWMLSQPDTITNIAALLLTVGVAYFTIAVAIPSIIKNFK